MRNSLADSMAATRLRGHVICVADIYRCVALLMFMADSYSGHCLEADISCIADIHC